MSDSGDSDKDRTAEIPGEEPAELSKDDIDALLQEPEPEPRARRVRGLVLTVFFALVAFAAGIGLWPQIKDRNGPDAVVQIDLAPLTARVAALESKNAELASELRVVKLRMANPPDTTSGSDRKFATLGDKLAVMEEQLRALMQSQTAAAGDLDAMDDLRQRLDALTLKLGKSAGPVNEAVLRAEIATIRRAAEQAGETAAVARAGNAKLLQRFADLNVRLTARADGARQRGLILAVGHLRASLDDPATAPAALAEMLQSITALAKDDGVVAVAVKALQALAQPIAHPSRLQQEFPALTRSILQAGDGNDEGSLLSRTANRLRGLVSVRRTGDVPGESTEAVIARAELKLARNDLAGTVAELGKLQGAAGKVAGPWLTRARGRLAAEAAIRRLTTHAIKLAGGA